MFWFLLCLLVDGKQFPQKQQQLPQVNCAWENPLSPTCYNSSYTWNMAYPACSLFQFPNRTPIPCQGQVGQDYCDFGRTDSPAPPQAASFHIHVFFPNPQCTNCSSDFTKERQGFTFAGAMEFRGAIASMLNGLTQQISGMPPSDPMDPEKAEADPDYNQCIDTYNIVAGAPANFHPQPCIYEVDAVKELGPFTDPETGLGYPNYSFFIPGDFWMPNMIQLAQHWLQQQRAKGPYSAYDVMVHPNTGCEVRDHIEKPLWMGKAYPLDASVFSCKALGCNQACPSLEAQPVKGPAAFPPAPVNCSSA